VPARHLLHLVALIAVSGVCPTQAAAAITCGTSDSKTNATAKATLEVDPDSVTTLVFKRDTDPQKMLIRFKTTGCVLPSDAAKPKIDVLPKQNIRNVPDNVLPLRSAVVDGSDYSLTFLANPTKFDPGTYGGFVEVRAPFLVTARAPISVSRSESDELLRVIPLGVIGGIVSLVWFLGLHLAKGATTTIRWWHYPLAFLAAAVTGVIAVDTAYRAQDVWSFSENGGSALVAAFTGATTGAMVAALAVLFPEPSAKPEVVKDAQAD
jgi:putative flippase GtrA